MFIYRYVRHPKQVGALCSSSGKLAFIITENIGLKEADNIVEIGAGTGAFTKQILKKKKNEANFFAIEIDQKMAQKLQERFENLDIEVNSAYHLKEFMQKRNIKSLDTIVSGIPWALLKPKEQERLLNVLYESLSEGGYFSTFAYVLPTLAARRFKKQLFSLFKEVKISKIVWQNIPPAFVYYCKK
ncbi:SAM-dependent methyltransferase [Campylobacter sp. MIT 12-5580]|uniref:class I SAM-dependent methyltransferase n=1 Tax=unclassified Campylobacter TaxID=2593542 RepID=UPI0010F853A4|nr:MULTISPECIES: rRNA adenine N-6-methyltransferase family protein [unclassified Campylobacter]NDJ26484.1 methyltransferase domain-containing protein [Campylobacter sp. MIT 19-121]TKX29326.1 SAM-dependent methyltransferase [Campylobacter sp. MIT 12-5580]